MDQKATGSLIEASVEWEGTLLAVGHFSAEAGSPRELVLEGMAFGDVDGMREALGRLVPGEVEQVGPLSLSMRYVTCEEPAPRKALEWAPLLYVSGAMVMAGVFLALMALVPPDGQAFSIPLESLSARTVPFTMLAPALLFDDNDGDAGEDEVGAEWGQEGSAGSVDADPRPRPRRRSERASNALAPRAAPERSGVLSLGAMFEGVGASDSPFEHALGQDADALLGALTGSVSGESFGFGGLAMMGTGRHGGGRGLGTIPLPEVHGHGLSLGGVCGCGPGTRSGAGQSSSGIGIGRVGRESDPEPVRVARVPHLRSAGPEVRGALDAALIRRVVRRHTNETRHCFEQALQSRPDLEGRVEAHFIIDPSGAVTAASLRSSSIDHHGVEACVLNVVRRMTFPATPHGNISVVTYPWVFSTL